MPDLSIHYTLMSVLFYPLLFLTGLFAGFVDTIAGGGGLITLPVLLGIGIPPQFALGTNKLQSSFGSGSATIHFAAAKAVCFKDCVAGIVFTFIGAAGGAIVVQQMSPDFLKKIIPFLLIAIVIYTVLTPKLGLEDIRPRIRQSWFYLIFGLSLGFYDGFFGPGTGSFWAIAFLLGMGFNLQKATAYTKVMNFTSNVASLLFFIIGGHVYYGVGLTMAAGQVIGGRLGSRFVMRKGAQFIRPVFIAVVTAIILKLVYDNFR
jgi:uncharacterized membrane protein YfcA